MLQGWSDSRQFYYAQSSKWQKWPIQTNLRRYCTLFTGCTCRCVTSRKLTHRTGTQAPQFNTGFALEGNVRQCKFVSTYEQVSGIWFNLRIIDERVHFARAVSHSGYPCVWIMLTVKPDAELISGVMCVYDRWRDDSSHPVKDQSWTIWCQRWLRSFRLVLCFG